MEIRVAGVSHEASPPDAGTQGYYYFECSCGFESLYNQTIRDNRKARDIHFRDVENERLWFYVTDAGNISVPFATKREALRRGGATSGKKVVPGLYEIPGGFVTTSPSTVTGVH